MRPLWNDAPNGSFDSAICIAELPQTSHMAVKTELGHECHREQTERNRYMQDTNKRFKDSSITGKEQHLWVELRHHWRQLNEKHLFRFRVLFSYTEAGSDILLGFLCARAELM
jgi:hypothetical protein